MHDAYISGRSENNINVSWMTISGGRTKQLDIFCCVTGFTSDFLSFIVVELIWFFHRAIQLHYVSSTATFLLTLQYVTYKHRQYAVCFCLSKLTAFDRVGE